MAHLNNKQADSGGWNEEDDGGEGAKQKLSLDTPTLICTSILLTSDSLMTPEGQKHRGPWWGLLDPPNNLIISAPDWKWS